MPSTDHAGKVIDKHAVAVSFSRAACSYDNVARIQRWVVSQLLQNVAANTGKATMLDIGCGTGYLTEQAITTLKPQQIVGLDIAEGMVKVAQKKLKRYAAECTTLCGDAESLPFNGNTFDLIVSSFALQWCPDLQKVFSEAYRVLNPGGRFYFTLPIGSTLFELKSCWQQVDPHNSHVNEFCSAEDLVINAKQAGFKSPSVKIKKRQEFYPDLKALTGALKAMGAHNVTQGRAKQLTGKQKIKQLIAAYEDYRTQEGIPATWEVAFGYLQK